MIADFEADTYGDWKTTGEAFGSRPAAAGVSPRNKVTGYLGKGLVNSFLGGDKTTGTLTNPFVQCMACSHDWGRTFTKLKEPIIGEINKGTRAPKVFWSGEFGKWIMILHGGPFLLFESLDLKNWKLLGEIPLTGLSECPELFKLPVDGNPDNTRWVVRGGRGAYCLGSFDGEKFTPDFDGLIESELANRSKASYAGPTLNDAPDGRRIMIFHHPSLSPGC